MHADAEDQEACRIHGLSSAAPPFALPPFDAARWPPTSDPGLHGMTVTSSSGSSSGRRFVPTVESMLHPVLHELAVRLPGAAGRDVVLFEEFEGPWGVPDLVALVADRRALVARAQCGVPALTAERDCQVVATVGRRWTAEHDLVALAGSSPRSARRRLLRLVEHGALVRNERGLVRIAPGIAPVGRVWALEAKVEAWRAGLAQTQRYRLWADGAVLVLGRRTVAPEVLLARARDFKVGVWAAGSWIARPRLAPPDPTRRLWASEHAWAALCAAYPRVAIPPGD